MTNVSLFTVAEAADGENDYVSWANLAPPEWSAGAVCTLPCQPFNNTQSPRPTRKLHPEPDCTQRPRREKNYRPGTPVFVKCTKVESFLVLTRTLVDDLEVISNYFLRIYSVKYVVIAAMIKNNYLVQILFPEFRPVLAKNESTNLFYWNFFEFSMYQVYTGNSHSVTLWQYTVAYFKECSGGQHLVLQQTHIKQFG